jgi:5,10-methylene-tetrahydrofolate dehydrogenase/methenyl tetrahydrofolate cyclohydrolase
MTSTADVVVATTGVRGLIRPEWIRPGQIVFALAAAHALAKRAGPEELLPDALNLETHRVVTAAVRAAAVEPVSSAL